MKVSLNWIKEFTEVNLPIDQLIEKIGSQLGAVEEVINLGKRYQGIVISKVVSCAKHPNADKLRVCLVDDNGATKEVARKSDGYIEVVCGAPNVEAGQLVVYIPPGTVVPSTFDKDPLALEARDIRGVVSNGMIASAKELAMGDDHQGILIIDEEAQPGDSFAKLYKLDDYLIDIENKMFTHRPDCFGMLGIAREIAGIQHKPFKSPDWYHEDTTPHFTPFQGSTLEMEVKNETPELVPRFCALAMSGIKVGPSPIWLQARLASLGVRPLNNIVDLTNLVMLETAQPLHAYDYDKINAQNEDSKGATLIVRKAHKGEQLTLLGGKNIKLKGEEVVVATKTQAIGLGGIMGGADTEVDAQTQNIIIEAANWDMNMIRKTAMDHGLFTDAANRFTKGQSPRQNLAVLARTAKEVKEIVGGQVASDLIDNKHFDASDIIVKVTPQFINSRLGLDLGEDIIKTLLENVEFKASINSQHFNVAVPFWRTDIEIPEDIIEEVGRLYGYDHLPMDLPQRDLKPPKSDALLSFKSKLRDILVLAGGNELLTYSFVNDKLLKAAGQGSAKAFHIRNALSPDLQYYRLSLTPSLLEKIHPNIKLGYSKLALFEIGKAHVKGLNDKDGLPTELERLAAVVISDSKGAAFYEAKRLSDFLLQRLGLKEVTYQELKDIQLDDGWAQTAAAFEPQRTAAVSVGEALIGLVGEPSISLQRALKLPQRSSHLELDILALQRLSSGLNTYQPLNRFPELSQDLCLKVKADMTYQQVTEFIRSQVDQAAQQPGYLYELSPLDIFQRPGDEQHKQITWHIVLWHPERTLTTSEINKLLDNIAQEAKQALAAERV